MRDRKLDRLFARWRSKGAADALGEVFDLCAPELSRLALHLVRDPAEADDLVQATFLTAIERSASFDPAEPLVPWLVGILVRHAHEARRKRERAPEHDRFAQRRAAEPHEAVEAAELSMELRKALDQLSERDRAVLVPYLCEGKRAVDIAVQTGLPAGTVRMQLHRGLKRLRKALPAGLSLGLAATLVGGRGLAAVRAEVLRHAALSTPIGAGAGAGLAANWTLRGVVVTKKAALAAVVGLAFGASLWMRASLARPEVVAPAQPEATRVAAAPAEAELGSPEVTEPDRARETRSEVAASRSASALAADSEEGLAGITGRLVHANGTPAGDVALSLLEIRAGSFAYSFDEACEHPQPALELEVSRARTAEDGRFRLGRARALGVHGLGIDLGGELGSLRVIDRALRPGEDVELGDVVLNPTATLAGRVVDERGEPLAGARVRAAGLSEDALGALRVVAGYQPRSLVIGQYPTPFVAELPAWLDAQLERLPVATAISDARGEFELAVPVSQDTRAAVLFDARGRPNRLLEIESVARGARAQLGDVVLTRGLDVSGHVVDASGAPVADADVALAGISSEGDPDRRLPVFARRAGLTDASGRFACSGLEPATYFCVAVRSRTAPAWAVVDGLALADTLLVKLPPTPVLRVSARDARGVPLEKVELSISSDSFASIPGVLPFSKFTRARALRSETEPGVFEVRDVPFGMHVIVGRAPGYAPASTTVDLQENTSSAELVFRRAAPLVVAARARATGAPVPGARVSLHEGPFRAMVASAITDANGTATVAGVPRGSGKALTLIVEHASFATLADVAVEDGAESIAVELDLGGELLAHVREDGKAPSRTVLLIATNAQGAVFERSFPLLGASDANGDVSMLRLSPGDYLFQVMNSLLALESGALGAGLETLQRGKFSIEAGRTTEITLELGAPRPVPPEGTARVRGRITLDGAPAEGWLVTASRDERATTNAAGHFEFSAIPVATHSLLVQRRDELQGWTTLKDIPLSLERGEIEYVELDLALTRVRVEVRDAGGRPLPGARVVADADRNTSMYTPVETEADGVAWLEALGSESLRVEAAHDQLGWGAVEVERDGSAEQTVVVTLEPGVSCSGRLLPPEELADSDISEFQLHLQRRGSRAVLLSQPLCDRDSSGWTFEIRGYPAGEYQAYLYANQSQVGPIPIVLSSERGEESVLDYTQ